MSNKKEEIGVTKDSNEATLTFGQEDVSIPVKEVSFNHDDTEEIPNKEYMMGPHEFEFTIECETQFESQQEYIDFLLGLGYTVIRDYDGGIMGVVEDFKLKTTDVNSNG